MTPLQNILEILETHRLTSEQALILRKVVKNLKVLWTCHCGKTETITMDAAYQGVKKHCWACANEIRLSKRGNYAHSKTNRKSKKGLTYMETVKIGM